MENFKQKAAFIDYSFKKKTHSSDFLKDILRVDYSIEDIWCDDWKKQKKSILHHLNEGNFHTVFFFQCIFSPSYLRKLKCKQIVWFPQYDSEEYKHYSFYSSYLGFNLKIFSFSKKLCQNFERADLEFYYYKYYPKPIEVSRKSEGKKVFFWTRSPYISWETVKKLLGKNRIEKTILYINPDRGFEKIFPTNADINHYNIQIRDDSWLSKEDFINLMSSCNIFIAPRGSEGIGMSFLEAISQGLSVVAADNSTMNEYIIDGVNGYLFDLKNPRELDLSNFDAINKKSKEDCKSGWQEWEIKKWNMLADIKKPNKKINLFKLIYLKIIHYPHGVIFVNFLKVINKINLIWIQKIK